MRTLLVITLAACLGAVGCGPSKSVGLCGNGVVDEEEQCDDGDLNSDTEPDACRSTCTTAGCGDGVVDSAEACDDGEQNSDTDADACRSTCVAAGCGDGVVDTGEACDDGAQNSDTAADGCRTTCGLHTCGDGVIDSGEECDSGPGCNSQCVDVGLHDQDGDDISDLDEGSETSVDTDGDGTPDFQDTDSDGDGILDVDEVTDTDLATPPDDTDGDGTPDFQDTDSDGDTIPDADEGQVDSDGDGIADFLDTDSDNDGIDDIVEGAGDEDGDGTPNYLDTDSDGDGIPDAVETDTDTDNDGTPNFLDTDSDNDTLLDSAEAGPDPTNPRDTDGDSTPDYLDLDSDGDGVPDLTETSNGLNPYDADSDGDTINDASDGILDTDSDGTIDGLDADSDGDGLTDAQEAGDTDLLTPPVDTDSDGVPDFQDLDSDNDGLSDSAEVGYGTDPYDEDSDNDGVTDLIEFAAGTDPNDPNDNPQANGDFVFLVPYQAPSDPLQDTLEFRTSVQYADLYFSFDETGSMYQEFDTMGLPGNGVADLVAQLTCPVTGVACIIDSDCGTNEICFNDECTQDPLYGQGCVPDIWTGVGKWNNCNTYRNVLHLQSSATATVNAIGQEGPGAAEAVLQSAACVSMPTYCSNNTQCSADPSVTNPVGCPGFRPEAVRILIQLTDADNQAGSSCGGVSNATIAGQALASNDIKFIGLYGTDDDGSGSPCTSPLGCANELGITSGTVDTNGDPFVYPIGNDGAIVVAQTRQAVIDLVRGLPLNVTILATDEPGDDGDSLQFIDYLEVNTSGIGSCTNVSPTADTDADNHDDAFPSLLPGTPVCWNVNPVPSNVTAPPTSWPQVFQATLTVYGDGSPLNTRSIYFLVPPVISD